MGLLTSSAAKHPEIIAIRYQLNLMELTRKLKTRRQHRGQPCTNNTDNIWRESRMTSSRPWTKDVSSQLDDICRLGESGVFDTTMHCDCVQYPAGGCGLYSMSLHLWISQLHTTVFFPSNAFMASARSSNTFNCMLQTRVN